MEQANALGISCIQFLQDWLQPYENYLEIINELSSQYHSLENLFPLLSVLDSVFASQLLLCMAFGGWFNTVLKWWILEDRPYWWVRETSYYGEERPQLRHTRQTCETGPGCPSGHSATIAVLITLFLTYGAHIATDRKWQVPSYMQSAAYGVSVVMLTSVFLARMYVAAHFPHQVVLGALVGLFLAPALCIYVSDPYIWCYGRYKGGAGTEAARWWHVASAVGAAAVAVVTYWGLVACNQDPQFTVKLAFRWCQMPEHIHVSTTPVFSLVQCTGYLLGWALAVTPAVAKYRHDTKDRSLLISVALTAIIMYCYRYVNENIICKNHTLEYYVTKFIMYALKPMLFLRIVPVISMWPYTGAVKAKLS